MASVLWAALALLLFAITLWQEGLLRKRDEELRILREDRDRVMERLYGRLADLRRWLRKP